MEKEVVGFCPVCHEKLMVTKLTCNNCKLDLTGDFTMNRFSFLTKEEMAYVNLFLLNEGSFKDVQAQLGITYLKAKQILSDILIKLELKDEKEAFLSTSDDNEDSVGSVLINENDHFVIKRIKDKLNMSGGTATINLITAGNKAKIWFDKDGNGLECDKIPVANQLTWDAFIAAYNIAVAQDGELYKGYARAGKLGSEKLPMNSLEGYIAHEVHGIAMGESAYSPGFVIAAVLDWVGIFVNKRGSTLSLVSENVFVESYEEVLDNAKTFLKGLEQSNAIENKLNFFRHWYYFEELDSFAPSKFIGYKQMNTKAYLEGFSTDLDGRDTERILQKYFTIAQGKVKDELTEKLEMFLNEYQKRPNGKTQIHIRK